MLRNISSYLVYNIMWTEAWLALMAFSPSIPDLCFSSKFVSRQDVAFLAYPLFDHQKNQKMNYGLPAKHVIYMLLGNLTAEGGGKGKLQSADIYVLLRYGLCKSQGYSDTFFFSKQVGKANITFP